MVDLCLNKNGMPFILGSQKILQFQGQKNINSKSTNPLQCCHVLGNPVQIGIDQKDCPSKKKEKKENNNNNNNVHKYQ